MSPVYVICLSVICAGILALVFYIGYIINNINKDRMVKKEHTIRPHAIMLFCGAGCIFFGLLLFHAARKQKYDHRSCDNHAAENSFCRIRFLDPFEDLFDVTAIQASSPPFFVRLYKSDQASMTAAVSTAATAFAALSNIPRFFPSLGKSVSSME